MVPGWLAAGAHVSAGNSRRQNHRDSSTSLGSLVMVGMTEGLVWMAGPRRTGAPLSFRPQRRLSLRCGAKWRNPDGSGMASWVAADCGHRPCAIPRRRTTLTPSPSAPNPSSPKPPASPSSPLGRQPHATLTLAPEPCFGWI